MINPLPATSSPIYPPSGFIIQVVLRSHALYHLSGKSPQENPQFFQVPR